MKLTSNSGYIIQQTKDLNILRFKLLDCLHNLWYSYIKEKQLIRISGYNLYPSVGSCLELNNSRTTVP